MSFKNYDEKDKAKADCGCTFSEGNDFIYGPLFLVVRLFNGLVTFFLPRLIL